MAAATDGTQLVIRNTFIDAIDDEDDDDGEPDRSWSDQTHLRSKCVQRLEQHTPQLQRATIPEDEDESGEEEDDDEDDDDGPLQRTHGVVVPAVASPASTMDAPLGEMMGHWDYMSYPMMPGPFDYSHMAAGMPDMMGAYGQEGYCVDESDPTAWYSQVAETPQLGQALPWGMEHTFHREVEDMGVVAEGHRHFTKVGFVGRLSVVSESKVHQGGTQRYLVQFSDGELSRADGVGFVFSNRLPCAKNIQRIVSIFVNQRGRICMRILNEIVRASAQVKTLQIGDWVEMAVDLEEQTVVFNVWQSSENGWPDPEKACSTATFPYGRRLRRLNKAHHRTFNLSAGHLACVVKNVGVTITLGS